MKMLKTFKNLFSRSEINEEALVAYYQRLPEQIEVSWFRDGNFIIGDIKAGKDIHSKTQAQSADEFIEMVNDGLLTVLDIPQEYFSEILLRKKFIPSNENELKKLNDAAIKKGSFSPFRRKELAQKVA